jgi:hypothetical protein
MTSKRRTLATLASVGIALLLVSCGVEAGDQAVTSTTTAPEQSLSPAENAMVDQAAKVYEDLGLKPDDAECLARGIVGKGGAFDPTDTSSMMDVINQCDISVSELNNLSADKGLDSMEDGLRFGLEASLKNAGLTDKQAKCVADALIDKYGTDVSSFQDPNAMRPLLEGCDVDANALGN